MQHCGFIHAYNQANHWRSEMYTFPLLMYKKHQRSKLTEKAALFIIPLGLDAYKVSSMTKVCF